MVIHFFTKFVLIERGRPTKVILQLEVVHNLPTKLPQKSLYEKSILFLL